jgi:hypothetical protein
MMRKAAFEFGYMAPNQAGNQQLSTGTYCLSSRSNVPYVTLVGSGGNTKTFSWGEIITIPEGEACTVKNSSFHGGDIFINAGCDDANRPARITVPVTLEDQTFAETDIIRTTFPADVRMARRAYLIVDAVTQGLLPPQATVIGKRYDGSHNTGNQLPNLLSEPGAGYEDVFEFVIPEVLGPIPLGKGANYSDDTRPHALLTTAEVYFDPPDNFRFAGSTRNAYYIIEY